MGPDTLRLPRGWPSIGLRGYRDHPENYATYSVFEYDRLPPIQRRLDDGLSWLVAEPAVEESLAGGHMYAGDPVRLATGPELDALTSAIDVALPAAFDTFVRTTEPRARVRSSTACYLDLGDFPVAVSGGGWLIHFLSDQQWVRHWLLYVDGDGTEAVVSTSAPYGFALGDEAADFELTASDRFEPGADEALLCADSFSEFVYRFWIENEIWFALNERRGLTPEQERYVGHYVRG